MCIIMIDHDGYLNLLQKRIYFSNCIKFYSHNPNTFENEAPPVIDEWFAEHSPESWLQKKGPAERGAP